MIRSFTRRNGRITAGQERALASLWPHYGVNLEGILDLNTLFGRSAEKHLEIGFGMGDTLVTMAQSHPEHDYLGIDVYRPGTGHLLLQIAEAQLTNVRVISGDVVDFLQDNLSSPCLDAVYLFFPDPWSKKRHHKRRLVQAHFMTLLAQRMTSGSSFHVATDWENYAEHMLDVLETSPDFIKSTIPKRPLTKFEKRGRRLGHGVWDFFYQRN
ncbi:MAG: tRNA (guanosine(46)-N7)-methyltransferase TrmB [Thiomargarita sp.]|nr:tRNA (guanosine(46)-N7)-methyltransferase TrmB [Thiomargarita sp.]